MARTDHLNTYTRLKVKESLVTRREPDRGSARESLHSQLCKEESEDFYNYLDWLDLAGIRSNLVLSKENHFLFSEEELQDIELVINLKCLNRFSDLDEWLSNIHDTLSNLTYFTGCFKEDKNLFDETPDYFKYLKSVEKKRYKGARSSAISKLSSILGRFFGSGDFISLNKDITKKLLRISGFTVLDMTELNGKTYFCVQKRPGN